MDFLVVALAYGKWHYSNALLAIINLWRNFIWFWTKFFSISDLVQTWLAPWRRLSESYGDSLDLKVYAEAFFINSFMRLVGVIIKTIVILIWLLVVIGTIIAGILAFLIWLFLPLLIVLFFIAGFHLIISA